MSNSKKVLIAGVAVLAVFAFAISPLMHAEKASAWGGWDGDFGWGWHHHHHHHHFWDWDDCGCDDDDWDW